VSPTKQDNSQRRHWQEPKLHQCQNGEINLGRNQTQSLSSPLANERTVCDYDLGALQGRCQIGWEHSEYYPVHLVEDRSRYDFIITLCSS